MAQTPVPEIHWFKTQYVVPEDRLRFSCTLKSGDTDTFWLTQRLASTLAAKLIEWLDKTLGEDRFKDLAHRMAQRSATAKVPQAPKAEVPETPGWLVHAVDVGWSKKVLTLTFKGEGGAPRACIRFDPEHLRRWLKVLHAQYRRSGWPTHMWPAWISDAAVAQPDERPGILH